jgi:transcriptional regulator with XRE-family HTH domain
MSSGHAKSNKINKTDGPMRQLRPPTLGSYLRSARRAQDLSRDQLAIAASVSSSYVTQLESGEKKHPSVAALRAIAAALELDGRQLRHLFNLAGLNVDECDSDSAESPSAAAMATEITHEMKMAIDQLEPTLAAYLDQHWNVLAANKSFAASLPGLIECGNVLRWYFTRPEAKRVVTDWQRDAELTVKWLRGYLGRNSDDKWATALLTQLSESPDFVKMWLEGGVLFHRDTPYVDLRDPDTGAVYTVNVQLHQVVTNNPHAHIGVCIGTRVAYPA